MHIGFDGKRAFQNKTGLGNYSRSLVSGLADYFPEHAYTLFAPKQTDLFRIDGKQNVSVVTPTDFWSRNFSSLWRRKAVVKDIVRNGVQIYHGVSNELPSGLRGKGLKSVVTVHDLIFERFPETYNFDERYTHRWKVKHACKTADAVIAISEQTKQDLISYYQIPTEKIFVCYQTCNDSFQRDVTKEGKQLIRKKYNLPEQYFLFVSSIAPRKNLLTLCKAMNRLKDSINIPLVIIGDGKKEKEVVKDFIKHNDLTERIIFLNQHEAAKSEAFISGADFPAIYQQAVALIYPSVFEGFGLPLLEAMYSRLPVICSNTSSLPEVAGEAALYFSPTDDALLAEHMKNVFTDEQIAGALKEKGLNRARFFTKERHVSEVMNVYKHLV